MEKLLLDKEEEKRAFKAFVKLNFYESECMILSDLAHMSDDELMTTLTFLSHRILYQKKLYNHVPLSNLLVETFNKHDLVNYSRYAINEAC